MKTIDIGAVIDVFKKCLDRENSLVSPKMNEGVEIVKIGINANTSIPCFVVIKSKGYEISAKIYTKKNKDARLQYDFTAKKDNNIFVGTNLEEVLGLITMWEIRGQNNIDWRADRDERFDYDKIIDEAPIFDEDGNPVNDEDIEI